MPGILAFAGSTRTGSWNQKLLDLAVVRLKELGAAPTAISLRDYPLPLLDEDLEKRDGLPPAALELKKLFLSHDALLLACPEYNSSFTPLLKNTLDWVSRPVPGEAPLAPFRDKVAMLLAASPGALGGMRGLAHVRAILGSIGVLVLPGQVAVGRAHEAFDESGGLRDERLARMLDGSLASLVRVAGALGKGSSGGP